MSIGDGICACSFVVDPSFWGPGDSILYRVLDDFVARSSTPFSHVSSHRNLRSFELDLIEVLHFCHRQMSYGPSISGVGRPEEGGLHRWNLVAFGLKDARR